MENLCESFKQSIGRKIKIDYCINGKMQTVCGILFDVNDNYIIIKKKNPISCVMCDFSSIKHITILK